MHMKQLRLCPSCDLHDARILFLLLPTVEHKLWSSKFSIRAQHKLLCNETVVYSDSVVYSTQSPSGLPDPAHT
jgi:hypothetical protein